MWTGQRRRSRRKTTDIAHTYVSTTTSVNVKRAAGRKATQIYFTTGVRGSLHTNQFLTRLESLGVKNKNTREAIRNRTVQKKTLSMSDMILKFCSIALNSKTEWTLQSLPTEITNKNMERYNLHLQASGTRSAHIA